MPSSTSALWLPDSAASSFRLREQADSKGAVTKAWVHPEYGRELAPGGATRRIAAHIAAMNVKHDVGLSLEQIKDAAEAFVASPLIKALGPSETVTRGDNRPWMFVPGRVEANRLVMASRDIIEPGHKAYSYRVRELRGGASWTTPRAMRSLVAGSAEEEEVTRTAAWYGARWSFNIEDLWTDAITGNNTRDDNQAAAVLGLDVMREHVCLVGEPSMGIYGLTTQPDALGVAAGQRLTLAGLAADALYARVMTWIYTYQRLNNNMSPSGVVAPMLDKQVLMQTCWPNNASRSVWASLVELYPWLEQGSFWDERMSTASVDGTPMWVFFSRNDREAFVVHTETIVFGPFEEPGSTDFFLLRRHGGLCVKRPEQLVYLIFS
jgi:hypothetical protein